MHVNETCSEFHATILFGSNEKWNKSFNVRCGYVVNWKTYSRYAGGSFGSGHLLFSWVLWWAVGLVGLVRITLTPKLDSFPFSLIRILYPATNHKYENHGGLVFPKGFSIAIEILLT